MPGVVFLIVVPTANFERQLSYDELPKLDNNDPLLGLHQQPIHNNQLLQPSSGNINTIHDDITNSGHVLATHNNNPITTTTSTSNNLNINLPDNSANALLRLEVELRDKNAPKHRKGYGRTNNIPTGGGIPISPPPAYTKTALKGKELNALVPMEKVLEQLLFKLEIDHVTWSCDKKGFYYHVVFPIPAGEPCETTLHCLTELGIGKKLNSSVSVLPCSVSYDAISDAQYKEDLSDENEEELSKWNDFVESIKSKLTVKQVVDGVRAGGSLSFDYLLLIVTADSLAALGLVENNAPNITAAMLVSPLMGPVMSITFGTIISDRELVKVGFISLALGMFISVVFGFIFGLILGTTEMPWGFGDWPTEEMRGRGNARSLWMGILWALTSGTGVAVALLQGSAGPLIGVAISASLLPPVVNCGLYWALACIWLIYPGIKIPHIKGETYVGNSTYEFIYTNYLPTEFLINGIVSGLLTVINVICIFMTAIIVLKIKEVSAPYTASPDLKRFWATDLRTARKSNRSTIRKKSMRQQMNVPYEGLEETARNRELETVVEQALQEASEDVTFQKVKRMSYSSNAAGELLQRSPFQNTALGSMVGHLTGNAASTSSNTPGTITTANAGLISPPSQRNSKLNYDLKALDKLVSALLEKQNQQQQHQQQHSNYPDDFNNIYNDASTGGGGGGDGGKNTARKNSIKLNSWRPLSRSNSMLKRGPSVRNLFGGSRHGSIKSSTLPSPARTASARSEAILESMGAGTTGNNNSTVNNLNNNNSAGNNRNSGGGGGGMPTILEQNQSSPNDSMTRSQKSSWKERARNSANMGVRNVMNSIVPQRISYHRTTNDDQNDEENINLTHNNIID